MLTTSVSADQSSAGVVHDLREVVRDLRSSKSLVFQLTRRDIRVRYKQAVMGIAWAVLSPLLLVAAGVVMRAALLHFAGRGVTVDAVASIAVKGVAWSFVAGAVTFGTGALTLNAPLISKIYFPRETLPLSVVLASTVDAVVSAGALVLILPLLGWRPTWAVLWAPALALLLFTLTLAAVLLASCANLFFRDVKYVVQLLVTFGVFFTPVFYEAAALGGRWVPLMMANPVAPVLEGLAHAVVRGHNLLEPIVAADGGVVWTPLYLAYSVAFAVVGLVASAVIFHRAQYRFAEYV